MLAQFVPTPTGAPTTAEQLTGATPTASLTEVVTLITKQYGSARAAQFLQWYEAAVKNDPTLRPLDGWAAFITGTTIATGIGGTAATLGGIPGAAAAGANSAYQDLLGGFNIGNWFLRIGEILLGLVLVGVGLARITGVQNFISSAVKSKIP